MRKRRPALTFEPSNCVQTAWYRSVSGPGRPARRAARGGDTCRGLSVFASVMSRERPMTGQQRCMCAGPRRRDLGCTPCGLTNHERPTASTKGFLNRKLWFVLCQASHSSSFNLTGRSHRSHCRGAAHIARAVKSGLGEVQT